MTDFLGLMDSSFLFLINSLYSGEINEPEPEALLFGLVFELALAFTAVEDAELIWGFKAASFEILPDSSVYPAGRENEKSENRDGEYVEYFKTKVRKGWRKR